MTATWIIGTVVGTILLVLLITELWTAYALATG